MNALNPSILTPKEIVTELDKYIIGQDSAKRAVAVALRNRYRRSRLPQELREEVTPKNILMIGPTGVGKTEIARRLAKLVNAPFVKVEATKFTEVGYVGRDVDSMIRDLVDAAIRMVKAFKMESVKGEAARQAEQRLLHVLVPGKKTRKSRNPIEMLMGNQQEQEPEQPDTEIVSRRNEIAEKLKAGKLEESLVEVEVEDSPAGMELMPGAGAIEINLQDMMGGLLPRRTKQRRVKVAEARRIFEQEEAQKLIDMDEVTSEALQLAEQHGIVFIDEIDKIAGRGNAQGPDVSREGVQRDILPLVEGSTVTTKYGPVKTDYMLFIAAGAFHISKVSDLIPELQGRFPIKVELASLTEEDFRKILTQPENALIKQYTALLSVDNIKLEFNEEALNSLAHFAFVVNESSENLGARRLHTIMESLLEDISFNAGGNYPEFALQIDGKYVNEHLKKVAGEKDLGRFII
jgi:ATP-dependent HslUV protease ATP-binding subunit HslU